MSTDHHAVFSELLKQYAPLADQAVRSIQAAAQLRACAREELLMKEGKHDANEYFLLEGLAVRFIHSAEGEMITTGFHKAPAVMVPHFARTRQQASIFSVQAVTHLVVAAIPASVFDRLRTEDAGIGRWGNAVVERQLRHSLQEETLFRSTDAKSRLLRLRAQYPGLENLVPHHLIASYLGITPVSFSRLRRQLSGR